MISTNALTNEVYADAGIVAVSCTVLGREGGGRPVS